MYYHADMGVVAVAKPPFSSFLLSIPSFLLSIPSFLLSILSFLRKQEPHKLLEIPGQARNEVCGALASAGTCEQSVCMPSYRYHTACSCGMIAIRHPGDSR